LVKAVALAALLPPVIVTAVLTVAVSGELAGAHPFTTGAPRNASEAIAMRDPATAARLIEGGAPVSEVDVIRAGILGERPILATPLEIAVMLDQSAVVDYLLARGAERTSELGCLAADVRAGAVRARLGGGDTCQRGEALRKVLARP
jgi:hypothetical protein